MSNKQPYIYTMPEEFIRDSSVPTRWRVWAYINGFFLNKKKCWASNDTIGEVINAHKDTVSQAVKELEELGEITCERTRRTRTISPVLKSEIGTDAYQKTTPTPISDRHQRLSISVSNSDNITSEQSSQEEDVVFEDDESVTPTRTLQSKRKPPKKQSLEVYQIFADVRGKKYPQNWLVNKTQRAAADNLVSERGLKAIRSALNFYTEFKEDDFCPDILSPYDLDSKWDKLAAFKKKKGV